MFRGVGSNDEMDITGIAGTSGELLVNFGSTPAARSDASKELPSGGCDATAAGAGAGTGADASAGADGG